MPDTGTITELLAEQVVSKQHVADTTGNADIGNTLKHYQPGAMQTVATISNTSNADIGNILKRCQPWAMQTVATISNISGQEW